ncbi:hypothetical protein [Microbispora rosea]|uniref:hypothetical protein n=1 Tax=Microbispora rosea TaxID=58117 RepID=UPI003D8B6E27
MSELWQLFTGLDERLANVLGEKTRLRDDLASADISVHLRNAASYRYLVEQQLQRLVRRGLKANGTTAAKPERVARVMSELCRVLLVEDIDRDRIQMSFKENREASLDGLVSEICEQAMDIRRTIEMSPGLHNWEWDAEIGVPVNPDHQDVWSSCDPDRPIRFLIAPAYMVDGHTFSPQIVFT